MLWYKTVDPVLGRARVCVCVCVCLYTYSYSAPHLFLNSPMLFN